jgi:hypothetical protein
MGRARIAAAESAMGGVLWSPAADMPHRRRIAEKADVAL